MGIMSYLSNFFIKKSGAEVLPSEHNGNKEKGEKQMKNAAQQVVRKALVTREKAFQDINETQEYYIDELISMMEDTEHAAFKELNFTSATGTGKTKMMAMLINRFPNDYFIVTTQSRGQLHQQIRESLKKDCLEGNFIVYGLMDYRVNSLLTGDDIINRIPTGARCFWLRDEGHIATNNYEKLLEDKCYKVINFSATNQRSDIRCNFTHTMMLRTVNQETGTPEDAINALLHVKEAHKNIAGYNPCAIFRCVSSGSKVRNRIIKACEKYGLKYIDLNENDDYIMSELCKDDNEYDVIINKLKIVEGIDIRRAHVLYMDNQPSNETTTIQIIGRCRRNALLYRNDIDIFAPENELLLKATRECYVFYNVKDMKVDSDENGELCYAFCPYISCQALKTGVSIDVVNGQMANGLIVVELEGKTGTFEIIKDPETGFNVVNPETDFYKEEIKTPNEYFFFSCIVNNKLRYKKIQIDTFFAILNGLPQNHFNQATGISVKGYFALDNVIASKKTRSENVNLFESLKEKYTKGFLIEQIRHATLPYVLGQIKDAYSDKMNDAIFLNDHKAKYAEDYKLLSERIGSFYRIPDNREFLKYRSVDFFRYLKKNSSYDVTYMVKDALDNTLNMIVRVPTLNNADADKIFRNYSQFYSYKLCSTPEDALRNFWLPKLQGNMELYGKPYIYKQDIIDYFKRLDKCLGNIDFVYINENLDELVELILVKLHKTSDDFHNNIIEKVKLDYTSCCEDLTDVELEKQKNHELQTTPVLSSGAIKDILMHRHTTIINDRESAIVGTDLFKSTKKGSRTQWVEASTVSSKITNFNKLSAFLDEKYKAELASAESQFFAGKNEFSLDRRFNSIIGYCAEYYSKYLVYGKTFMERNIRKAAGEAGTSVSDPSEIVIIRACILQYHDIMKACYGQEVARLIPSASITTLTKPETQEFINLVVKFGTRAANYVKATLYPDIKGNAKATIDPILAMRHISGIADYITKDTILDIKVTNYIDKRYLKQVLAYHYLSTKRSDVKITRVIVYDATSDKAVVVPISTDNISTFNSPSQIETSAINWVW